MQRYVVEDIKGEEMGDTRLYIHTWSVRTSKAWLYSEHVQHDERTIRAATSSASGRTPQPYGNALVAPDMFDTGVVVLLLYLPLTCAATRTQISRENHLEKPP